jgi:hypothetical protein
MAAVGEPARHPGRGDGPPPRDLPGNALTGRRFQIGPAGGRGMTGRGVPTRGGAAHDLDCDSHRSRSGWREELMPVPTARVWRRYGHLRIYISAGDVELGWCDPRSGRFQLHHPAMAEDFWTAVRAECGRLLQEGRLASGALPAAATAGPGQPATWQPTSLQERAAGPGPPAQLPHLSAPQPAPASTSVPGGTHWIVRDPRWSDLAGNTPGESARARAKELRARHPLAVTAAQALGIRTAAGFLAMAQEASERSAAS